MHSGITSSLSSAIRCPFNTVSEVLVHNLLSEVKNGPLTQLFYSYGIHELWVLLKLDVIRYYVPLWNAALLSPNHSCYWKEKEKEQEKCVMKGP